MSKKGEYENIESFDSSNTLTSNQWQFLETNILPHSVIRTANYTVSLRTTEISYV